MSDSITTTSIRQIQGTDLFSPLAGQNVKTHGVVTAVVNRGFFIQTPNVEWDAQSSDGIFVYSPDIKPSVGKAIEVEGEVVDFLKHDLAKPVTQIHLSEVRSYKHGEEQITLEPIELNKQQLDCSNHQLAKLLNSLEGMLIKLSKGATLIAPSNPFGDYVLAYQSSKETQNWTKEGGLIMPSENPLKWYPGFRITNYNFAPRLNVGSKLLTDIVGPLNYRSDSYQIACTKEFEFEESFINLSKSKFEAESGYLTIMTLNCFNLDIKVESEEKVINPTQDIDDDWGDGRFHSLAQAIVLQANCPDIVALQEIQDNDGAEFTQVTTADQTYRVLAGLIEKLCDVKYQWVNLDPELGADGGQPGGNIRNGFLYNPQRVSVDELSVKKLGLKEDAFNDSRKPLSVKFIEQHSQKRLHCINVHLASKRHQRSIFAPEMPGFDAKLEVRKQQAKTVADYANKLADSYYITGDFNDTELSETINVFTENGAVNLVDRLAADQRYDYNHRGKLQVLMHGIISPDLSDRAEYEIIHGNELIGVKAGESSDKPSDHAYVMAKIKL